MINATHRAINCLPRRMGADEAGQGTRDSKTASSQVGRVVLDQSILVDARKKLHRDGVSRDAHGDYFVYGYVLGAEKAVTLNIKSYDKTEKETKQITVAVKVLFVKASKTWTDTEMRAVSDLDMDIVGYDTLEKAFEHRSSKDRGSLTAAGNTYKTFDNAVRSLQDGVKERLRSLGLCDQAMLTGEACDKLFDSGLVRQLVLLPYRTAGLQ